MLPIRYGNNAMVEVADFLFKITPLVLGVSAFFIAPAAERLKRSKSMDVVQGQTVDLAGDRIRALENDILQEREINRLQILLTKHGIKYDDTKEDDHGAVSE